MELGSTVKIAYDFASAGGGGGGGQTALPPPPTHTLIKIIFNSCIFRSESNWKSYIAKKWSDRDATEKKKKKKKIRSGRE